MRAWRRTRSKAVDSIGSAREIISSRYSSLWDRDGGEESASASASFAYALSRSLSASKMATARTVLQHLVKGQWSPPVHLGGHSVIRAHPRQYTVEQAGHLMWSRDIADDE